MKKLLILVVVMIALQFIASCKNAIGTDSQAADTVVVADSAACVDSL